MAALDGPSDIVSRVPATLLLSTLLDATTDYLHDKRKKQIERTVSNTKGDNVICRSSPRQERE